jgi:hypothetical protein
VEVSVKGASLPYIIGELVGHLIAPGIGIMLEPAMAGSIVWHQHRKSLAKAGQAELRTYVAAAIREAGRELTANLVEHARMCQAEVEFLVGTELAAQKQETAHRVAACEGFIVRTPRPAAGPLARHGPAGP